MKIECKLIREGGTIVDIGGVEYHFEPLADGAHVAEVSNDDHADRFLAIPEGYKLYRGKLDPKGKTSAEPSAKTKKAASSTEVLLGSSVHESSYEIGGKTYALGDIVTKAHTASGLTTEAWNALAEDERHAMIDGTLDELAEAAPADDREALAAEYKAKFGKAPHHNASIATIKAKLAE